MNFKAIAITINIIYNCLHNETHIIITEVEFFTLLHYTWVWRQHLLNDLQIVYNGNTVHE